MINLSLGHRIKRNCLTFKQTFCDGTFNIIVLNICWKKYIWSKFFQKLFSLNQQNISRNFSLWNNNNSALTVYSRGGVLFSNFSYFWESHNIWSDCKLNILSLIFSFFFLINLTSMYPFWLSRYNGVRIESWC